MPMLLMGRVLAPLVSGVVACPTMLTWPALLRTSTGKAWGADAEKPGAVPFQLAAMLLPFDGAVAAAGIVGVLVNVRVSIVPPAAGPLPDAAPLNPLPEPTRRNSILSMLMMKSSRAVREIAAFGVAAGLVPVCRSAHAPAGERQSIAMAQVLRMRRK